MNLDHIKLFVSVYKAGNFISVAKDLDIAASSVSRAIASLEDQLQTRLFQRTTRKLKPTQSGELYFQRVEALVEELEITQQEIAAQNSEPFGRLRVTASTSFGQTVLAPLLKGFHDRYPNISLELTLSDSQANIVNEQFDIAIRHGKLNDSNLVARKLLEVRYCLVASADYLKKSKQIKTPSDIQHHKLVSFSYSKFNKEWRFRNGKSEQTVSIKPIVTITAASAIKECIKENMGIAILPDWIVKEDIKACKLVHVLTDWQATGTDFDTAIWLVYPSRAFVPAKTTAFINHLLDNT